MRAAGNKGIALHVGTLVHHKGGHSHAALRAGNGSRTAGVYHRNLHVGMEGIDFRTERLPGEGLLAQAQALFIGVTAVIDQHLVTAACRLVLCNLLIQIINLLLERSDAGFLHLHDVPRLHTAHFLQHVHEGAGIACGIAECGAAFAAVVGTYGQHVAVDLNLLGGRNTGSRSQQDQCDDRNNLERQGRVHLFNQIHHLTCPPSCGA